MVEDQAYIREPTRAGRNMLIRVQVDHSVETKSNITPMEGKHCWKYA